MEDPEAFLGSLEGKRIVLDGIHRLANLSELLKIAADHLPNVRLLATGPSSLSGSGLGKRLLEGGLPPFFLAPAAFSKLRERTANVK